MQLIDQPRALAMTACKRPATLIEDAPLVGERRRGGGLLGDRESMPRAGLDGTWNF